MASTQGLVGGSGSLTIDGEVWNAKDIKASVGGVKRETVIAQTGVAGYTEMPLQASFKATIINRSDKKLKEMVDKGNATIILRMNNKKVYTASEMWLTNQSELNTQEGTYEVEFEGVEIVEDIV